jgi:hypothetical protein
MSSSLSSIRLDVYVGNEELSALGFSRVRTTAADGRRGILADGVAGRTSRGCLPRPQLA